MERRPHQKMHACTRSEPSSTQTPPFRRGLRHSVSKDILRNFSLFGKAADYKVLNTEQVSSAVRMFTSNELLAVQKYQLEKTFKGFDERDGLEETLTNPDSEIIPEVLKKGRA
ncbi:hypothetical protein CNMCM8927_004513 [Aspergillus lentulus]|uniref:Uncharacterized protein n=1 Tax=Aspergillus lentulus TaxID=293939 RepID=A0AAN5YVX3_ASPLE|nr:hypothetical protein CNMCM8927_004513 [Aspergillus lentulus]